MTTDADLSRDLIKLADEMDEDSLLGTWENSGLLRRVARRLVERGETVLRVEEFDDDDRPRACRCGAPLPYSGRGRPREWCSERCRDVARKSRK